MELTDSLGIILAVILGSIIGMEREINKKAAGLRTNVLICLGAAIFTIISRKFGSAQADSTTRIAAQIVTGIGFLGAGAIIQDRGGVHGMTTAASVWLVASIGMACGAQFYSLAIISTVLAIAVLLGLKYLTKKIERFYKNKHFKKDLDDQRQTPEDT